MGNYCTLEDVKSVLEIDSDVKDVQITLWLPVVKLAIDHHCNRVFDAASGTKYYDGSGDPLLIDDLVTLTSIKLDEDGDGVFEATLATTDYILYPLNEYPKTTVKLSYNSEYSDFASGIRRSVEVSGVWGYSTSIPDDVKGAAVVQVAQWVKRGEAAFQSGVSNPVTGEARIYKRLDPQVAKLLEDYIDRRGMVG